MTDKLVEGVSRPAVLGVERADGTAVVRLAGELDLHNAGDVREALAGAVDAGATRLVVDLSEVAFADLTAVGVLLEARARLGGAGLVVACPQAEPRRALEVSGADRHLPVAETVGQALAR